MPKFLIQACYNPQGAKGVIETGGTRRRTVVEGTIKELGGTLEAFYFAFGETDAFAIVDVPDNASAAAVALVVNAAGGAHTKTTVLLTPEEVDQASAKSVSYTPPGG